MYFKRSLLFLLLLAGCPDGYAQRQARPVSGVAVRIIDGDTFDLLTDNHRKIRVRLYGIDCPERGQAYYRVARKALDDLCYGQRLRIIRRDKDRYSRTVADVYLAATGRWINEAMVAGGYAWHFTRYNRNPALDQAQRQAQQQRKGLWQDATPVAPWEWRHTKRAGRPLQ